MSIDAGKLQVLFTSTIKKYPSFVNSHAFCIYAIVIEWPVTIVDNIVTPGKINLLLLASPACKDVHILFIFVVHTILISLRKK